MTVHPAVVMWRFLMGPPDSDPATFTNHYSRGYPSVQSPKELDMTVPTNNPVHTKPLTVSADTANRLVANLERQQAASRALSCPFVRVTELTKLNHIRAVYTYYVASDGPNWVVRSNGNLVGKYETTFSAAVAHDAIVMFSMADGFVTK